MKRMIELSLGGLVLVEVGEPWRVARDRGCRKHLGGFILRPRQGRELERWEPAGPWDYRADGRTTKHWAGVHPNGGYYEDDTQGIVDAYEHRLQQNNGGTMNPGRCPGLV